MKVLWAINVYGRRKDLKILTKQLRHHYGDSVTILVYCSNENAWDEYRTKETDVFLQGPNSGHHNGVRDALNVVIPHVSGHDVVVCSHADNLWSDLGTVDLIISEMTRGGFEAAVLTGGEDGAMGTKEHYGYYADWFALTPPAFLDVFPIGGELDGVEWIETALARHMLEKLGKERIFDVPCRNEDRLGRNVFVGLMGTEAWMAAGHDLEDKVGRLESVNKVQFELAKLALAEE